jgi:hypothetical protein
VVGDGSYHIRLLYHYDLCGLIVCKHFLRRDADSQRAISRHDRLKP